MLNFIFYTLLSFQTYAQNKNSTSALNQTLGTVAPVTAAVPSATPAVPTATTTPAAASPPSTAAPNLTLSEAANNNAKYEEYQSICRTNKYDLVANYSSELKKKRSQFLKDKIVTTADKKSARIELRLAKEYLDQKEIQEFKTLAADLKTRKLSAFENEFLNALLAFSVNNLISARTTLVKLLVENKDNIDVLLFLAEVYLAEENYFEASAVYEDLNKLTKNFYLIQHCQAMVLNSLNADGENLCLQAAIKNPKSPLPYIFIGITQRERGDFKRALQSFKKSVALKPTEMGLTCLAEIFFIKENFTEAIEQFKKSAKLNIYSERAVLGLAWANLKQKNYVESLAAFKTACKINSKNQFELRKAFKELNSEKISVAKKFIESADSCGGG